MAPNAVNADEIIEVPYASRGISNKVAVEIKVRLPDFLQSVNLKYVKLGYHIVISHALYLFMIPLLLIVAAEIGRLGHHDLLQIWEHLQYNLVSVLICFGALVFVATLYFMSRPRPVYLIDFTCYKPEGFLKVTMETFIDRSVQLQCLTESSIAFQRKIISRSGLGQETYLPRVLINIPRNPCMSAARLEAEEVMFGAIDELLVKTGVKAKDIAILIVNCSLFNPTPSLSAMIDREPLQDAGERVERELGRDGVQRGGDGRRHRERSSSGSRVEPRACAVHGKHHSELVQRKPQNEVGVQLLISNGRRGGVAFQQAIRETESKVRAATHYENAQRRRRESLSVRASGRRRERGDGNLFVAGAHGGRGGRVESEYHHNRAACTSPLGAAPLRRKFRRAQAAQLED